MKKTWSKPKIVEIAVGMEINTYACARLPSAPVSPLARKPSHKATWRIALRCDHDFAIGGNNWF